MTRTAMLGDTEIEIIFRADPMTTNYWGAFSPLLNAFVETCEECNNVVGHGNTIRDAANDGFDNGAVTDGGDEGSGNVYCAECYERLWTEAYNDAMRSYDADFYARLAERAEDERDNFLAAADLARDIARGK